jgi:hypothetical protein
MSEQKSVQATMPWSGMPTNNAYSRHPCREKGSRELFNALTDVCARRTPEQRAELLEQRLLELRAAPPRGFPQ